VQDYTKHSRFQWSSADEDLKINISYHSISEVIIQIKCRYNGEYSEEMLAEGMVGFVGGDRVSRPPWGTISFDVLVSYASLNAIID
jgi:hypothetical protein